MFFFFFSSRRRHTRWNCDWSSDVCSSDLRHQSEAADGYPTPRRGKRPRGLRLQWVGSEERRVGKECRSRGSPHPYTKKGDIRRRQAGEHFLVEGELALARQDGGH